MEILVKAVSNTHSDPEKDRRGCYKKGYPVVIMPDGHTWGTEECLPRFVVVKCPQVTVPEAMHYINHWRDDFQYTIASQNAAQGKYTVRIQEGNVSASGINKLTTAKVSGYLEKWGCDNTTYVDPYYQFDFSLWNAVRSEAFWGRDVSAVTFTLDTYNSTSGVGRIQVEVPSGVLPNDIIHKVTERGGTIVSSEHPTYVFDIERSDVLTRFRADVKSKLEQTYCRRQYYFTEAQVDTVISAGGSITLTKTQLLNALKNKLNN
jgi:hypothetical protein